MRMVQGARSVEALVWLCLNCKVRRRIYVEKNRGRGEAQGSIKGSYPTNTCNWVSFRNRWLYVRIGSP